MTAALAAYFLLGNLYTTTVADNALIANTLVLTTMALVILGGTEDTLAEQTITLRLVGTIVDCLGLQHLTMRVLKDFLG